MSADAIVRDWLRCLRDDLLPGLHGHQHKALADLSVAVALSGQCPFGRWPVAGRRAGRGAWTLLADRGLAWPVVIDTCAGLGWHYLLRLQGGTKVILPDGREVTAAGLVGRVGGRWLGRAWLFKKAGWRAASVLAYWPWGRDEPWLLVGDEGPCPRRFATYGQRTWAEELFRDAKS